MEDELTGAVIQESDADGDLGDPVTDRIARAASDFYPNLRFDPKNIKVTFEKAITSESDPKIKCLLQLIEGLYLARKQNNDEHNELFHRFHLVGKEVEHIEKNIGIAFENSRRLYENDTTIVENFGAMIVGLAGETDATKKSVKALARFRKKHEPRLRRLAKYIEVNADKLKTENKELR